MNVVTRIPPSPTGHLHIGTVRTALFNYLFTRHHGGTFLFRSEDTDRARSKREYEEEIIEGLTWLGLTHDGEIVRQSERQQRHTELLQHIVAEGKAYVSKEESQNEPGKTVEVVRLKNPGKQITFVDEIRGEITFDTTELGDFVIARAIDDPLYHFAVVVDDADAGITHVIRGEDHISNTPRQILIQEALGVPRPIYAHLPLILASDRSKMSKRHGAVSLLEYKAEGFLPGAILNYLALLGWSPKDEREDFSLEELVQSFDLSNVHKSGAVFDITKFKSVNQRWMRKLSDAEYVEKGNLHEIAGHPKMHEIVMLLKERAQTFTEARTMLEQELKFLFHEWQLVPWMLMDKEPEAHPGSTKAHLEAVIPLILGLGEPISPEGVKETLMAYADQIPKEKGGRGAVLWPLRYALSSQEKSPDPFTIIAILGKEESVSRIQSALGILKG